MEHPRIEDEQHEIVSGEQAGVPGDTVLVADRSAPGWGTVLTGAITLISTLAILSMIVSSVFFEQIVALDRQRIVAPLLVAVAAVPALGIVALEFVHVRAMTGYRFFRERTARRISAWLGLLVALVLVAVHPLIVTGILIGAGASIAAIEFTKRRKMGEPLWDFRPEEALAILSGRDAVGFRMADETRLGHPVLNAAIRSSGWFAMVVAFATGSWLVSRDVLGVTSIAAVGMFSWWAVAAIASGWRLRLERDPHLEETAHEVIESAPSYLEDENQDSPGLLIRNLLARDSDGRALLDIGHLEAAPGAVIGIAGEHSAGKSLLMRAIASPFDLEGLAVSGRVTLDGMSLWDRRKESYELPLVWMPSPPILLSASGAENLSGFSGGEIEARGRRMLERFVFSTRRVDMICNEPDATRLSTTDRAALAMARAFALGPRVFLMDRPEEGLSEKTINVLCERIVQETRIGKTFLIATSHRRITELCDSLVVLQGGHIVDRGPAEEIRARNASGWSRFVGARGLETEETLETWLRSQFVRDNDEGNRRKVASLGLEMLLMSCQSAPSGERREVAFEFKHHEGFCVIRMSDDSPEISATQLARAEEEAAADNPTARLSPLARLFKDAKSLDTRAEDGRRVIEIVVETYDPRKRAGMKAG